MRVNFLNSTVGLCRAVDRVPFLSTPLNIVNSVTKIYLNIKNKKEIDEKKDPYLYYVNSTQFYKIGLRIVPFINLVPDVITLCKKGVKWAASHNKTKEKTNQQTTTEEKTAEKLTTQTKSPSSETIIDETATTSHNNTSQETTTDFISKINSPALQEKIAEDLEGSWVKMYLSPLLPPSGPLYDGYINLEDLEKIADPDESTIQPYPLVLTSCDAGMTVLENGKTIKYPKDVFLSTTLGSSDWNWKAYTPSTKHEEGLQGAIKHYFPDPSNNIPNVLILSTGRSHAGTIVREGGAGGRDYKGSGVVNVMGNYPEALLNQDPVNSPVAKRFENEVLNYLDKVDRIIVCKTRTAIKLYNQLAQEGLHVAALIHTTC